MLGFKLVDALGNTDGDAEGNTLVLASGLVLGEADGGAEGDALGLALGETVGDFPHRIKRGELPYEMFKITRINQTRKRFKILTIVGTAEGKADGFAVGLKLGDFAGLKLGLREGFGVGLLGRKGAEIS